MSKPSSRGKPLAVPPREIDVAQRAVVHVEHALPLDAPRVDAELVAVVDVVVDQRREQVVRELDRAEIAGEVQVDVLHRHHLRVAAAGSAPFHAEHRAERGLAQADHRLLADVIERIAQAHRGRGLALAGRGRRHRGDQDELAVLFALQRIQIFERDLGLVVPVRLEMLFRDAQLLARDSSDALQFGGLRDFDVRRHGRLARLLGKAGLWESPGSVSLD